MDREESEILFGRRHHVQRRRWPSVGQIAGPVQNAINLSLSSLYLCDEASGNLVDRVGSSNLTAAGTPVYQDPIGGKLGVGFNSTTDGFAADVHDLGTTSGFYLAVIHFTATNDTHLFGRSNATSAECALVAVAVPGSGTIRFIVNDSGANSRVVTPATDVRGKTMLAIAQIDRTANLARVYLKERGGSASTTTGDITGWATVSGASQAFGLNNLAPTVTNQPGGFTALLVAVATGAQTEGTAVFTSIAERLHF